MPAPNESKYCGSNESGQSSSSSSRESSPGIHKPEVQTIEALTAKIIESNQDTESTEKQADSFDIAYMEVYREKDEPEDSDSDEEVPKPSTLILMDDNDENGPPEDSKTQKFGHIAKGELTLDDLPPVEKLSISVPVGQLKLVGRVYSFVDRLMVVESLPGDAVLNFDTVLFLEDGKAVGQIFDVIGPVKNPFYVLRFNNQQEIEEEHLKKGVQLFCAPTYEDYTFLVFQKQIDELMKLKGSDASWEHDLEPPEDEKEYSDDEKEREAKREKRNNKRKLAGKPVETKQSFHRSNRDFNHNAHPHGPPNHTQVNSMPANSTGYRVPPVFHPHIPPPGHNPWAYPHMSYPLPPPPVHYGPFPTYGADAHPNPYAYAPVYTAPYGPPTTRPVFNPGQPPNFRPSYYQQGPY